MKRESDGVFAPRSSLWGAEWSANEVVRLLEPLVVDARRERLLAVIGDRIGSVTVLMDAPHDPHNGAAVLRSCDAFGVPVVHVVPRREAFLVAGSVAKGTERWVDVVEHPNAESAIAALESAGYELVATHPKGELEPEDLRALPRVCLVLGNEHEGISEALSRATRRSVKIPMRGFVESLNVSVSAAILLRAATLNRTGDLPAEARELAYARALFHSVGRASEILQAARRLP